MVPVLKEAYHHVGEGANVQNLVFGKFTPQIEEWRGRGPFIFFFKSWFLACLPPHLRNGGGGTYLVFFGHEKLQMFILALFKKTVIGPFFEARSGPRPGPGARAPHPPNSKF